MKQGRTVNVKLNLLKGLGCMAIVIAHFTVYMYPAPIGPIIHKAAGFGVPIFLMISGYYAFGKDSDVIKRRLIKIIKIFLFAYVVYFLYNVALHTGKHDLEEWFHLNYNSMTPMNYICFCTIDYVIPLWYLIAMIETYIVWWFVVKWHKEDWAIKLMPFIFLFQILLIGYVETLELGWYRKTNFLACAMPWFLLGYYLKSDKSQKLRSLKSSTYWMMVIVGCALVVIPVGFDLPIKFTVVGFIPFSLGMYLLALRDPSKSICKPIEFIGDKLSLDIYLFHTLVSEGVKFVYVKLFHVYPAALPYVWLFPVVVLAATILICWGFYHSKQRIPPLLQAAGMNLH